MILQNLALKRGKEAAGHNIQIWTKRHSRVSSFPEEGIRQYATDRCPKSQLREELAKEHVKELSSKQKAKKVARAIDKDFFVSILGSSATKREAKSYIQRFTPSNSPASTPGIVPQRGPSSPKPGVNLGSFYAPTAVEETPRFVQHPQKYNGAASHSQLHVALVKIRAPQDLEDETLNGICRTLSQLGRLGLVSIVVVDCDTPSSKDNALLEKSSAWRALAVEQANRVVSAIDSNSDTGSRLVENVIGVAEGSVKPQNRGFNKPSTHVTFRNLLMTPLKRGVIPVVPCVAYTDISQVAVPSTGSDVVFALSKELAGVPSEINHDQDPIEVEERLSELHGEVSLDRLIILDPLGGIPTPNRPNGYHVFLNIEQEFEPAKKDLLERITPKSSSAPLQNQAEGSNTLDLDISNPLSKSVETKIGSLHSNSEQVTVVTGSALSSDVENSNHLKNLELVRSVLKILPPSSSAILTTPEEAANSGNATPFQPGAVGTRRHRNPLIHNLLTDKPVFSSSLPLGRLGPVKTEIFDDPFSSAIRVTPTTFAKLGMPITIFPDPAIAPWKPPAPGKPNLSLTDPDIDLLRLVHLIDDSFGRKLDVNAYLERVNNRIAGVIIAGEYEGGAILTWETPPGVVDDGSPESRARMVPYLDKFAVLKKAQGSGGVADVVFTAMVRDCFPNGVVWRSRTTNVVNKWYFERSRGTWKLSDSGWTMFWTTPDMDRQTYLDYEGVCRGIKPSWADGKKILD